MLAHILCQIICEDHGPSKHCFHRLARYIGTTCVVISYASKPSNTAVASYSVYKCFGTVLVSSGATEGGTGCPITGIVSSGEPAVAPWKLEGFPAVPGSVSVVTRIRDFGLSDVLDTEGLVVSVDLSAQTRRSAFESSPVSNPLFSIESAESETNGNGSRRVWPRVYHTR